MRFKTAIIAGLGLAMAAVGPASAFEAKIYPVHTRDNFCPAGLQPVSFDGTVSCGTPNQSISYQHALMHPVAHKHVRVAQKPGRQLVCPVGEKSCYYK